MVQGFGGVSTLEGQSMKKMLTLLIGAACTLAMADTEFKNVPVPL
jgi:hypothetical protein